ncbi:MAG: hypothetical protein BGO37_10935 [Cellulomonas sp. 73-92]|uniref:hypothetical protein n=1 Tax=Cellulomonas sp. 73-92 TaxID=1895740 RepID=UPI0009285C6E|nr:hypothetical protein [Cellulomonas sp. 73-92]OJV76556.1 MAG: hypothetical protein BGO37_10935 [Cellulomonas sp. 73-92]
MAGHARIFRDDKWSAGKPAIGGAYALRNDNPAAVDLTILRGLVAQRRDVEERTALTVQKLRAAGASWTVIGDALGTTRSSAQKRYGGTELV